MFLFKVFDADFESAEAKLGLLYPQFIEALQQTLDAQTRILAEDIQLTQLTGEPLKTRSGALAESVQAVPSTVLGNYIEGYVQAGGDEAPYARFFVSPDIPGGTGGTQPHIIEPREAQYMEFFWEREQRMFFRGLIVHHPGFDEHDFMTGAFNAWVADLPPYLQEAVDRVINA